MAHVSAVSHRRRAPNARRPGRGGPMMTPQSQLNHLITAAANSSEQDVLRLVEEHSAGMGLVNVCTAWHSLACFAKPVKANDHRLTTLTQRTQELLLTALEEPNFDPHPCCVATITWSLAKLKVQQTAILSALGDLGIRWLTHFKSSELVNVLWGFAKLKFQHAAFLQVAHNHLLEAAHLFNARSLSLAAWSFATIRFQSSQGLLSRIAEAFVSTLKSGDEEASPVTIANMVWALASGRAHVQWETLLALRCAAVDSLEYSEAHELSVILWSLVHLNVCDEALLSKAVVILRTNARLCEDMQAQDLANLLWSFARSPCRLQKATLPTDLVALLFGTCLRLLPKLTSAEISTSASAIARLMPRFGEDTLADCVLEEVAKRLLAEETLLSGLTAHGSSEVLSAYTDFFCDCPCVPAPCADLCARLSQRCSPMPSQGEDSQGACEGLEATDTREDLGRQQRPVQAEPVVVFLGHSSADESHEVEVEFEVDCAGRDDIHSICVDTYGSCKVDDRIVFPVASKAGHLKHKLKVQQPCGRWYVSVSVLSTQGEMLGKPASSSFPGSLPAKRLAVPSFASASTFSGSGSEVHSGSESDSEPTS